MQKLSLTVIFDCSENFSIFLDHSFSWFFPSFCVLLSLSSELCFDSRPRRGAMNPIRHSFPLFLLWFYFSTLSWFMYHGLKVSCVNGYSSKYRVREWGRKGRKLVEDVMDGRSIDPNSGEGEEDREEKEIERWSFWMREERAGVK